MTRPTLSGFLLLLWLISWGGAASRGSSTFYNAFDTSNGLLTTRLGSINSDGSADQPIPLPLLNPAYPAVSRDGQVLALAAGDPARPSKLSTDIYLLRPATGQFTKVSAFEDIANASGFITFYPSYLSVSPDGQKVAAGMVSYLGARRTTVFTNQFGDPFGPYDTTSKISRCVSLMVFNANGTAPYLVATALCDDDFAHPGEGVDWSPTQDLIAYPFNTTTAFGGAGGLLNITAIHLTETTPNAADLGRRRQLTFPSGIVGFPFEEVSVAWSDDFAPAFSPDGRQIAYVRSLTVLLSSGAFPLPAAPSIRIIGTDGTGDHEVIAFQRGSYITRVSWAPDGKQLVFDLGAQALRSGFPLRTWTPDSVSLARVNVDGTGLTTVRGPGAAWPVWLPGSVASAAPAIVSLDPASLPAGSPAAELVTTGTGFTANSVVLWKGDALRTTFISSTQLRASVDATRLLTPGPVSISVSNGSGAGNLSNTFAFAVTEENSRNDSRQLIARLARGVAPSISLSWNDLAGTIVLESSPSLGAQAHWTAIPTTPVPAGSAEVTLPATEQRAFFRLRAQ